VMLRSSDDLYRQMRMGGGGKQSSRSLVEGMGMAGRGAAADHHGGGGGDGGSSISGSVDDDDARSEAAMSVRSAPEMGGAGLSAVEGLRRRRSALAHAAPPLSSGDSADDDEAVSQVSSQDSGPASSSSQPISIPSSGFRAARTSSLTTSPRAADGGGASRHHRSVHFVGPSGRPLSPSEGYDYAGSSDGAGSERSGRSAGASSSSSSSRRSSSTVGAAAASGGPSSVTATSGSSEEAGGSDSSHSLPAVPQSVAAEPQAAGQGGIWYELFPYCGANADGRYRTAVDELTGLAMTRPKPRLNLPGEPRTLGYLRLRVELNLLTSPYACYLRRQNSRAAEEGEELSIARLKANWRRVKAVLMPNSFILQARRIASWESKLLSSVSLALWSYISLLAPLWQYPIFFFVLMAVLGSMNRDGDRLLKEVVVWEDYADPDQDPFSLRKVKKIRRILVTVQMVLGRFASFVERLHYVFSWSDPIVSTVAVTAVVILTLASAWAVQMLYILSCYVGGRTIWFLFGCVLLLPPRLSLLPWNKVDRWSDACVGRLRLLTRLRLPGCPARLLGARVSTDQVECVRAYVRGDINMQARQNGRDGSSATGAESQERAQQR
jgi:hypothetical protein